MEINWGIPSKRKTVVEKYPNNAVMIMHGKNLESGYCKFEFNKKAIELLNIDLSSDNDLRKRGIGFNENNDIFISKESVHNGMIINKNGTFSNGKLHHYICNNNNLDENLDYEFEILEEETLINAFKLNLLNIEENINKDINEELILNENN